MKDFFANHKWILLSIIMASIITFSICYIYFWYLIIIPGIIAGIFNQTIKKGTFNGVIGVIIGWSIHMIIGVIKNNTNIFLDQIGVFFIGEGYGWLIFLIILLIGALFGALGGSFGSVIMILIKGYENYNRES